MYFFKGTQMARRSLELEVHGRWWMGIKTKTLLAMACLMSGCGISNVFAQLSPLNPNKPIKMIVGYTAGGAVDLVARSLS